MNSVSHFVIDKQPCLSDNTEIVVQVGRFIDNGITDLRFREQEINNLLDSLKSSQHFTSLYRVENRKIYKHLEMEYLITRHSESCITNQYLASETKRVANLTLVSNLIRRITTPIEQFPTKLNYEDEICQTSYYFKHDDQIELRLTCEKGNSPSYWKVTLVILKENIYRDRLAKNLEAIIDLLDHGLTREAL